MQRAESSYGRSFRRSVKRAEGRVFLFEKLIPLPAGVFCGFHGAHSKRETPECTFPPR